MLNVRPKFPDIVNGYPLDNLQFSLVLPVERTNLVLNPSFETNTTGYTSVSSATLTRTTEIQRHGIFSLKVKPSATIDSGLYYTTPALTAGVTYAFSLDVFILGGQKYVLRINDNVRDIGVKPIVGKGYWQRFAIAVTAVTTGSHRMYLQKDGTPTNAVTDPFFTDGWQVEACNAGEAWPTTYIDGDQQGFVVNQIPPAYYWMGTPHASTSVRSGQTRAGGRVVSLNDWYGLTVTAIVGLGEFPIVNSNTPYALIGGANYQRTLAQSRPFTIVGSLIGRTQSQIMANRKRLERDLDAHLSGLEQPILLKYVDSTCAGADGELMDLVCLYNAGLTGNTDNYYQEKVGLQFVMFDPFIRTEGDKSVTLSFASGITSINQIGVAKRGITGVWTGLTTNNATVKSIIEGPDGSIYIGGNFLNINGVGATQYIARWDGTQWLSVGGGLGGASGDVKGMSFGNDGKLYVTGAFTSASGLGAVNKIAVYNPVTSTWAALGTGLTGGDGYTVAVASDNSVYVGGDFTLAGGVANTVRIAKWDGANWSALGSGISTGIAKSAILGIDGFLYVGGSFAGAGGVALTNRIARWNGFAWQSISASIVNSVNILAVALDGTIYAAGDFTSIGGTAAQGVAKYNGNAWAAMGVGITAGTTVNALAIDKLGNVYIGGSFTSVNNQILPDSIAIWTGTGWVFNDADFPGPSVAIINALTFDHIGNLYVGFSGNAPAILKTGGIVTVNNRGNTRAEPVFVIDGPGQLFQIANFTTGKIVYFNITLLANERVTLTLKQGNLSFVSNFRGNILATVLPGSSLANFELAPGNNNIGVFILNASGSAGAYLTYRETYNSVSGSIRQ